MTFEDRLDRLTERHEALTQGLEFITIQTEKNSKDSSMLRLSILDLVGVGRSHDKRIAGLEAA